MNPEKLAMLAAKSMDMLATGGGIAEITAQDIAGAMHKLDDIEYEVLSIKYVGTHPKKLMKFVEKHAQLKVVPPGNRKQVAIQAILEALGPNTCPKCKGTKNWTDLGKVTICSMCEGLGVFFQNAGMYQRQLDRMVSLIQRIEGEARGKMEDIIG